MQQGYARGGMYAFIVIIGIVLLLVRRLKPTLLALLPVILGGIWTLACMALLDLDFNMANLIILPLFLGIAVDNGIHMVHRMMEDKRAATAPLAHSTGKAIVLASLTTMVGFGSLIVAHHYGIFSLGVLSTLAVGCNLIAALVALPLVLHLFPGGVISPPTAPVASEAEVPNDGSSVETRR
jgi:predicted RND superfamily exporter protein